MRKDRKSEDRDYLKQFENKSVEELLDILSKEAEELKQLIKSILNRGDKNGKD
ncbi:hypothetical protein FDG95_gp076 [Pectobacterium phage vB_PcaM_CBB]|uniref:Uncharacterized protein n=1 Tax=Pectobacterium phage vB_PcaM_CBB TaxID=2772511 RepID=A0A1L2CUE5_9CAUD|nr:hypothetical protein FDG95_gp076 [Pectobacterium phage vB_PcaM_CBB]AMM43641.1 hypothetical protein CBB_76 [Pectobacterium phage vB_PcaM_CBB]